MASVDCCCRCSRDYARSCTYCLAWRCQRLRMDRLVVIRPGSPAALHQIGEHRPKSEPVHVSANPHPAADHGNTAKPQNRRIPTIHPHHTVKHLQTFHPEHPSHGPNQSAPTPIPLLTNHTTATPSNINATTVQILVNTTTSDDETECDA